MSFIPVLWTNVNWYQSWSTRRAEGEEEEGMAQPGAPSPQKPKVVNDEMSMAETTDALVDMTQHSCYSDHSGSDESIYNSFGTEDAGASPSASGPLGPRSTAASISAIMKDLEANPGFQTTGMEEYAPLRRVQDAVRNCGSVELMEHIQTGNFVVVKRMPNTWVGDRPSSFSRMHTSSTEKPWMDIGIVRFLHQRQCPYVCEPYGLFRDREFTYVMSAYAELGDLFSWCGEKSMPMPGPEREEMIKPIAKQVVQAVQWLHHCGIAHRDISLENVVLTSTGEGIQAKLIDFGMAATERVAKCVCGKPSYQAPEMHERAEYDAFLADAFSTGVTLLCMATTDYPWLSTRPDSCSLFKYVRNHGMGLFIVRRKVRGTKSRWADVLSEPLVDMLLKLLQFDPENRCALIDNCSSTDGSTTLQSICDCEWLK